MTPEAMLAELDQVANRATTFGNIDAWTPVAEILYEGFTDNFARAATAEGVPWPPRKSRKALNPLLILTGLLIRSVGGKAESIYAAHPYELILGVDGSGVKYAAIHNEGSERMPQREYLNVNEETSNRAAEVFVDQYSLHLFPPVHAG